MFDARIQISVGCLVEYQDGISSHVLGQDVPLTFQHPNRDIMCWDRVSRQHPGIPIGISWDILCLSVGTGLDINVLFFMKKLGQFCSTEFKTLV